MEGEDYKSARLPLGQFGSFALLFAASGDPVVETLEALHADTRDTVAAFKRAFDFGSSAGN